MVFAGRLLAQEFELADIGLEFLTEAIEVLAEHGSELKFGGGASGGEPGGIGLGRAGEEAFQLCQSFLGTDDLEIGLLQLESALVLDALAKAEQAGRERNGKACVGSPYSEVHIQAGSAMRRSKESFIDGNFPGGLHEVFA